MDKIKRIPVTFYLPKELFERLENLRGYEKRASYIQRHLEKIINSEYSKYKKKNDLEWI